MRDKPRGVLLDVRGAPLTCEKRQRLFGGIVESAIIKKEGWEDPSDKGEALWKKMSTKRSSRTVLQAEKIFISGQKDLRVVQKKGRHKAEGPNQSQDVSQRGRAKKK